MKIKPPHANDYSAEMKRQAGDICDELREMGILDDKSQVVDGLYAAGIDDPALAVAYAVAIAEGEVLAKHPNQSPFSIGYCVGSTAINKKSF